MRRLLPARVAIAESPADGIEAARAADVVLLEDRAWPLRDLAALAELRELSAARRLAIVLSRRRGEHEEQGGVPVVERPYRIEEVVEAMRLAMLRRKA